MARAGLQRLAERRSLAGEALTWAGDPAACSGCSAAPSPWSALVLAGWMAWRIVEKAGLPGWAGLGAILLTLTGIGTIVPLILLWVFAFMRWPRDEMAGAGAWRIVAGPGRHRLPALPPPPAALADRRAWRLSGLSASGPVALSMDGDAARLSADRRRRPAGQRAFRARPVGRPAACAPVRLRRPARPGRSRHAGRHPDRRRPAAARARPARYQRGARRPRRHRRICPVAGLIRRNGRKLACDRQSPPSRVPGRRPAGGWIQRGDDGGGKLIYDILGIYSGIIIASAIMSWLVAFGVVNVRNQFIRMVVDLLYRAHRAGAAPDPPHPAQPGRRRHLAGRALLLSRHPARSRELHRVLALCRAIRRSCAAPPGRDGRTARPAAGAAHRARMRGRRAQGRGDGARRGRQGERGGDRAAGRDLAAAEVGFRSRRAAPRRATRS